MIHIVSEHIAALRCLHDRHSRNAIIRKLKPVFIELNHSAAHFTAGIRIILGAVERLEIIAFRNGVIMFIPENILRCRRMLLNSIETAHFIINPRPIRIAAP
ncbi:hypothetical protein D3C73_1466030 [compost metagenome]